MTRVELLQTLLAVARAELDEEDLEFDESTPFAQIESWDSFTHLAMVVGMEKAFQIRFENSDLMRLKIVADLLDVIERRRAG
jgi:acyl carrier protein